MTLHAATGFFGRHSGKADRSIAFVSQIEFANFIA